MYPREYIQFLAHFHGDRDYFECHEVLEEYWKKTDSGNKSSIWVGLILLAVSTYHHRRSNFNGANRTLLKALKILDSQSGWLTKLGLDQQQLNDVLNTRLSMIENKMEYKSFNLPFCDPLLKEMCEKYCEQAGFEWGLESDFTKNILIHRHKLRDRSSVVEERDLALKMRKGRE